MVSCSAINCGNSSFKYKIEQVKQWHWVLSNDKTLWKKWLAVIKGDPPYPMDNIFHLCTDCATSAMNIFSLISSANSKVERRSSSYSIQQLHQLSVSQRKWKYEKKKHDIIDEVCSFSKHSNDAFENIDITHVKKIMWLIQNIVWLLTLIFLTLLVHNVQIQVLFDAILC